MRVIWMSAAITILLTGCTDAPKLWKRSEIETIAEDFADASGGSDTDVSDFLDGRIDVAFRQISELETKVNDLESDLESAESKILSLERENSTLSRQMSDHEIFDH